MVLPWKTQPRQNTNALSEITALISRPKIIAATIGTLLLVLIPYFHLGVLYTYWNTNKDPVDTKTCSNTCWDTLFKGSYESGKRTPYKHIYFNITHQTFKIWALSAVVFIVFYETIKYLCQVLLARKDRRSMLILFCTDIYPHYYGWWMYFNAWNDDFYKQWYHQAFFSLTELASTVFVVYLCTRAHEFRPRMALVIMSIALLHILVSSGDQFVSNVLYGKGAWHQFVRDIGFMVPDMLHILLPAYEMWRYMRHKRLSWWEVVSLLDLTIACGGIALLWIIVRHL